jgi:hypothetical protein
LVDYASSLSSSAESIATNGSFGTEANAPSPDTSASTPSLSPPRRDREQDQACAPPRISSSWRFSSSMLSTGTGSAARIARGRRGLEQLEQSASRRTPL